MKTLLLSLVVMVGFVYLVSGYVLKCHKCNETVCDLKEACEVGKNLCFILQNNNDTMGMQAIQGCAETCPIAGPDQEVKCCNTDYCNSYF
ncbi:probable weak neurotoxin 3FTx-Lio1 [Pantherophis guttatus]|uniref:Probable weak neurotoxin 3FTx-Lio1 n=1 Tax=Pantherophis guttatus TaxID=94885 RepID=A0A6P9C8Z9_PANGU|nr:probable weak neurotoxin 3FTx-Lio1 [Pantherophis guttatus]XP_060541628.1 probable weak neurotoxin 3FTx-Lio1 [Pantherophis guttatus]